MPTTLKRHIALQGAAIFLVLSLAWPYFGWMGEALPWRETSFAIGAVALCFASWGKLSWPGRLAHAALVPAIWLADSQNVDPGWLLAIAMILLVTYRLRLQHRVQESEACWRRRLAHMLAELPETRVGAIGISASLLLGTLQNEPTAPRFILEEDPGPQTPLLVVALPESELADWWSEHAATLAPGMRIVCLGQALPAPCPALLPDSDADAAFFSYRIGG